jgi:hypothetical protein
MESFRSGYMGSQVVLRISARSEFGDSYDGGVMAHSKKTKRKVGGTEVGNDTVFLVPSEYLVLREKFDEMAAKCD